VSADRHGESGLGGERNPVFAKIRRKCGPAAILSPAEAGSDSLIELSHGLRRGLGSVARKRAGLRWVSKRGEARWDEPQLWSTRP
jgi:hypothetical protein